MGDKGIGEWGRVIEGGWGGNVVGPVAWRFVQVVKQGGVHVQCA